MPDYLIALADRERPALRRAVADAIAAAESAVRPGQGGDEGTLLAAWSEEAVPRIAAATKDMAQRLVPAAGKATLGQIRADAAWRFDAVNPRAVALVQTRVARLVVDITRFQEVAIQQAIGRVVSAEISVGQAAKHIRSVIGLTGRMEQAVWNVRMDAIKRALPAKRVDQITARYRAKVIRERAETIARTETIDTLSAGRVEAWQQAIDDGLLSVQSELKWVVTYDDRLCPVCAPMAGERVPIGGTFSGGVSHPPRHPRCRCAVTVVRGSRSRSERLRVTLDRVPVLR